MRKRGREKFFSMAGHMPAGQVCTKNRRPKLPCNAFLLSDPCADLSLNYNPAKAVFVRTQYI